MSTRIRRRESEVGGKGEGWKWIPQQSVYLWWDGKRYTSRAEWDGTEWQVGPVAGPPRKEPPSRSRHPLLGSSGPSSCAAGLARLGGQ